MRFGPKWVWDLMGLECNGFEAECVWNLMGFGMWWERNAFEISSSMDSDPLSNGFGISSPKNQTNQWWIWNGYENQWVWNSKFNGFEIANSMGLKIAVFSSMDVKYYPAQWVWNNIHFNVFRIHSSMGLKRINGFEINHPVNVFRILSSMGLKHPAQWVWSLQLNGFDMLSSNGLKRVERSADR